MDIIDVIREEQELDRLLFREGMSKMANFYKIGKRTINLDNVTEMVYEPEGGYSNRKPCVRIDFVNSDDYISVYKDSEPEAFAQVMTWMDERPTLVSDEE